MLVKKPEDIKSGEITDKKLFLSRRSFIQGAALVGSTLATGLAYRQLFIPKAAPTKATSKLGEIHESSVPLQLGQDDIKTPYERVINYNNFYEFSTYKQGVASRATNFVTSPWSIAVEGLAHQPKIFDYDELLRIAPLEERVYRMRCVEGWSMVIPWIGFPLAKLLDRVQPTSQAKYVAFQTLYDPDRFPNQQPSVFGSVLDWPYVEGLRMDEALHPLTILAVGLYGETLPAQNGSPIRLVVPWKYGFKGIKSIVKIKLVDRQPPTTWNLAGPREYGFYSNVNPTVDHPRWSQAKERRIGEFLMRDTLMFNGYADQVAQMYSNMDLRVNY